MKSAVWRERAGAAPLCASLLPPTALTEAATGCMTMRRWRCCNPFCCSGNWNSRCGISAASRMTRALTRLPHWQIKLPEPRMEHQGRLIALVQETLETGGTSIQSDAFDKSEQRQYVDEIRKNRGGAAVYQEYQRQKQDGSADTADLMQCFATLGRLRGLSRRPEVQAAIGALQRFITDHFYTCTADSGRSGQNVRCRRSLPRAD